MGGWMDRVLFHFPFRNGVYEMSTDSERIIIL